MEFEDRLLPGHSEGSVWIIKSLELYEMILRSQQSALEVRHEDTIAFQDCNLIFIIYHFIVKGSIMFCFQGGTNTIHQVGMA